MKKSIWEDKGWSGSRGTMFNTVIGSSNIPIDVRRRVRIHKDGLWETPKTYDEDGYAYNDGTWLIYNTCRITNGKFRNRMLCKSKDDVIRYAYSYLCFLVKIGITEKYEMSYYALCFVDTRLALPDGVFSYNMTNRTKIDELVVSALKKGECVECYRYDDRKFCISPKMGNKDAMRQTKRKEMNYDRIMELYDASKTLDQNVFNMKRNGVEVSNKTLRRCLKDRKVK